ncbi:MAG: peptidylprolyl isomerase [Marivibrio sp.]|uniref:peptidylprolyl isomerase n=1 Tax=Marivibrio sp. TaxID=2039719 RepID=UPI0032EE46AA
MIRTVAALIPALALAAGLSVAGPSPAAAQSLDPAQPAAVVGGETITLGEVRDAYRSLPQQYQAQGFGAIYPSLVENLVQQKVLEQRGREAGLASDPEVQERLAEVEGRIIGDTYLSRAVEDSLSEERLRGEYERWLQQNPPREEVKARHILVDTKEQAADLIRQMGDGADFAALAQEHSMGPSGAQGGDLGWFQRGQMVPAFNDAAFGLEPNTYTAEPIQTEFGWHVILVEDKRTVDPASFEEMRPRLVAALGQERAFQVADEIVDEAEVQRFDLDGGEMAKPQLQ